MKRCNDCQTVPTAYWEPICDQCAAQYDSERFLIGTGPPSFRYRVTRSLGILLGAVVAYLVLYKGIAPILRWTLADIGGDLGQALGLTFTYLIVGATAIAALMGCYFIYWYIRGENEPTFSISNVKIQTTLIGSSKETGPTISNWETGLYQIASIEVSQGPLGRLFNYGNVILRYGTGPRDYIELEGVTDPFRLMQRIQKLVQDLPKKPALLALSRSIPERRSTGVEPKAKPSRFRVVRYALIAAAVIGLPTYCNMKTMFWSETINPGQTRDVQLWANTMVLQPGGPVPEFQWEKEDQYSVKADVLVDKADKAEKAELIEAVQVNVDPGEVLLIKMGQGFLLKVEFRATIHLLPNAPAGDIDFYVVFRHPKFVYPPVVEGEPHAQLRVKVRR